MDKKLKSQKGQALILIAFGMVALIAMTGLAIDGGNAFSDRRHAQNAADTAALSAALAKVSPPQDLYNVALARASSNGYTNDGVRSKVEVRNPPVAGFYADCNVKNGPYTGNGHYVQVIIHSYVDTFFARIIGQNKMESCVEAIARASPSAYVPFAFGNAIAAMDCHGMWTLKFSGNSDTLTVDGGVFSNSDDNHAVLIGKNFNLIISSGFGVSSVGILPGVDRESDYPSPIKTGVVQTPCPDGFNLPDFWYPKEYTCDITEHDFPDDFNIDAIKDGESVYEMETGKTYCITGSFKLPNKALYGESVHFVMINEGIHWNGQAELHLSARLDLNDPLNGILIYLPKPNKDSVVFNGTASGSSLSGTIFAPNSEIVMNGDFSGTNWQSQIIGATVTDIGGMGLKITYIGGINGGYTEPARIELAK